MREQMRILILAGKENVTMLKWISEWWTVDRRLLSSSHGNSAHIMLRWPFKIHSLAAIFVQRFNELLQFEPYASHYLVSVHSRSRSLTSQILLTIQRDVWRIKSPFICKTCVKNSIKGSDPYRRAKTIKISDARALFQTLPTVNLFLPLWSENKTIHDAIH